MIPDYRTIPGKTVIAHSAKGSTWKKHKYVKVLEGVYFYPDNYKGGRHIGQAGQLAVGLVAAAAGKKLKGKTVEGKKGESAKETDEKSSKMSSKKIDKLAQKVISGKYGNGQERMDKLGKKYAKVQNRVNQILLGDAAAKRIYDRKKKAAAATKKSSSSSKSKSSSSTKKKTK